ncbi:hypothetical protein Gotri_017142 [Gossypium trilobum]|uniref:Exostosin GT47 domain-containing protein n=1 Tax=Gossypium trilobum TaxID=34281 RepID=A0A7J9E705_9ROSI|nr:hypothetical protein [Gossypium trilobum]
MEKPIVNGSHCHNQLWFIIRASFVFCLVLLCLDYSVLSGVKNGVFPLVSQSFSGSQKTHNATQLAAIDEISIPNPISNDAHRDFPFRENNYNITLANVTDSCSGKYIYVHRLPTRFNNGVLRDCRNLIKWFNMCPSLMNAGIKQYKCLTNDSSMASAVYVPFYAGLDVGRYLWGYNTSVRDSAAYGVADWLRKQHEWNRMFGQDHFFVAGRIAWDFRRQTNNESEWGSKLMNLPEFMNITMLSIESSSWSNEFAIPYPTYFHPLRNINVVHWQKRTRTRKRRYLFCFAGAPRPTMKGSIRGEIINQCLSAPNRTCKFLDCKAEGNKCDTPVEVIKVFRDCNFCLQPPGDSYTRRSTFDSIISGCIPVFFHPYSAYAQYIWYFPKNYTKYSVYIPQNDIKNGNVSINRVLSRFSEHRISEMRKEVVKLIPKVIYANPKSRFERFEDAIDIALKKVTERVNKVGEVMKEGKGVDFAAGNQWKLKLAGIVGDQALETLF